MKIIIIITLLLFINNSLSYAQSKDINFPIRMGMGLGFNIGKDKLNERLNGGPETHSIKMINGLGYNFYSNVSILIHNSLRINAGINVSVFNHGFKSSYSYNDKLIFDNIKFNQYHTGIEIPITINYDFYKLHNGDFFSVNLGLMHSAIIAGSRGMDYISEDGFQYYAHMNTHVSSSYNIDPNRNLNVAFTSSLSYFKRLMNNDFLEFRFIYSSYLEHFDIAVYTLKDADGNGIAGGVIDGYFNNLAIGVSYTFSFQRSIDKAYNKGYDEGLKIN